MFKTLFYPSNLVLFYLTVNIVFFLNAHFPVKICYCIGLSTSSHVLLASNISYSISSIFFYFSISSKAIASFSEGLSKVEALAFLQVKYIDLFIGVNIY